MTTKELCKNLIRSFKSCNLCQHDLEIECEKLFSHTFSFEVDCNAYGVKEIKKGLINFLQSKNWLSKNISVKSNL